jgi:type I restriction enzyme S subunit
MTFSDIADVHTLEELCKSIQDGDWIETKDQSSAGYRLLQIGNIAVGKFRESGKPRYVSEDTFRRLNCTKIEIGDVLIARMPEPTGRAWCVDAPIPDSITSVDVAIVRVDPTKLNAKYLAYFLNQRSTLQLIASLQTGSTRQRIKRSDLATLEIRTHSLDTQQAIANFLTNLDEKIASNSALSETLEVIAQTIFKSWFIDFDPVKAKMVGEKPVGMDPATAALFPDSMQESELGLIPRGWKVRSLDEISEYLNGLAMQKFPVIDENEQLPVIKIAQLRAGNTKGADMASGLLDPKFIIKDGDILFSWSGTLEVETWTGGSGALNQHLFKVTGKNVPDWYSYLSTKSFLSFFRGIASGKATTMGHIQRGHLSESKLAIPNSELLNRASEIIEPIITLKIKTLIESRNLAEIRDSLLPRLISGELQIPEEMSAS